MLNDHKKILILGSTGSIGKSACNCVRRFRDRFTVAGLAAGNNVTLLMEQIREFSPEAVYVTCPEHADTVKQNFGGGLTVYDSRSGGGDGGGGLARIAEEADYDILLNALVGAVGFRPTVAALRRGKRVALANKESLVIGGDYIRTIIDSGAEQACTGGAPAPACTQNIRSPAPSAPLSPQLLPVDSEHSAILQCLPRGGLADSTVESIILTASGGPFRGLPAEAFASITPEQALSHPTWSMGKKITIDSSTLMNKGFELIEAHHLFSLPYSKLKVCVHPQSIIHSLVEFHDGAVLAQLGLPDMELPIQYALSWPERLPIHGKRLNLAEIGRLEFYEPDMYKFPCLRLCIDAGKIGGTAPAAVNAANEAAVDLFLNKKIGFTDIARIVEAALNDHVRRDADSVEAVESADRETRQKIINQYNKG